MRKILVLFHRYVGLLITPFLVVIAITGSILAFHAEIDSWFNETTFEVPVRKEPMLDPLRLREIAEAQEPKAEVQSVPLLANPGDAFSLWLSPKSDPVTGLPYDLSYDQLLLNPYTGQTVARLTKWEAGLEKRNFLNST